MRLVRLASEIDFDGWRAAARGLRSAGVAPGEVLWSVDAQSVDLFSEPFPLDGGRAGMGMNSADQLERAGMAEAQHSPPPLPLPHQGGGFSVPRTFVDLAGLAILHRSPDRFARLYSLLWRLQREPHLMEVASDPEVAKLNEMAGAVSRASHKMKAFVRFRLIEGAEPETYAAWFEPPHRVVELTAPFFARRFSNMNWSILTPDACAHWDQTLLSFSPGADPADAPGEDALEAAWTTYYASIFNPARLKPKMMQKEMPKRYWGNLPEAKLIPELIAQAERRTDLMVAAPHVQPSSRALKAQLRRQRDATYDDLSPDTLEGVAAGIQLCDRCPLHKDATQGVPGQGPKSARLMFVGEQPGDQEDLAGLPFVGPAGQVFDRALTEAGIERARTRVTNAVRHFKHELRGKRRIHKTPDRGEVQACRWWLDAERAIVRPRVIVMLGATAAFAVTGKQTPIAANRGVAIPLKEGAKGVVTYHPSFLLRLPDEAAKRKAYAEFVEDLRFAAGLAG